DISADAECRRQSLFGRQLIAWLKTTLRDFPRDRTRDKRRQMGTSVYFAELQSHGSRLQADMDGQDAAGAHQAPWVKRALEPGRKIERYAVCPVEESLLFDASDSMLGADAAVQAIDDIEDDVFRSVEETIHRIG